jgi:hypothetical protein
LEQRGECIKARLVGQAEDGAYTTYVFQDLEKDGFIMVTRVPNWKGKEPTLLQEGFLEYKYCEAGTDTYYDNHTQTFKRYQYDATYFLDFVPITHVLKDGRVTEVGTLKFS